MTDKKPTKKYNYTKKTGHPPILKTSEEAQVLIDTYFKECIAGKKPATVPGLAYALGFCNRKSVWEYGKKPEFRNTIKKAMLFIEDQRNVMLLTEQNAAGKIFDLKNNFGWIDKTEHEERIKIDKIQIELV